MILDFPFFVCKCFLDVKIARAQAFNILLHFDNITPFLIVQLAI